MYMCLACRYTNKHIKMIYLCISFATSKSKHGVFLGSNSKYQRNL